MSAPLDGIRVLEVANWLAAPAAAALLADLGADVIKVEPPGGEVYREFLLRSMGYAHEFAANKASRPATAASVRSRSRSTRRAAPRSCAGSRLARTCIDYATFDVLAELGVGEDELAQLATDGVI
jgi:CoA transferase family III